MSLYFGFDRTSGGMTVVEGGSSGTMVAPAPKPAPTTSIQPGETFSYDTSRNYLYNTTKAQVVATLAPKPVLTEVPGGSTVDAARAQRAADAAAQAELERLLAEQRQAELDAAAADAYHSALGEEEKPFPWLWVGIGGAVLVVGGLVLATKPRAVSGYRRRRRR